MDDIEARLRVRLERLAAAVPVRSSHEVMVERVRPSAALVRPPSATLLVAALLVAVVAVGVGLASRSTAPATSGDPSAIVPASSPTGSASPAPSPSNAGASLVVSTTVEEPCPQTEGGRCEYRAVLKGPGRGLWEWDLLADGSTGPPSALAPGTYSLRLEARYQSDVIDNRSFAPAATDAVCATSFVVTPTTTSVPVTATFTRGLCTVVVGSEQTPTQPPAGIGLPYPEGCAAYGLSPRRCAYIVDWALDQAGLTADEATVQLLGDPLCVGRPAGCGSERLGGAFVVLVRVAPQTGQSSDHLVTCGLGGESSMLCSDTPFIRVSTPMAGYHDVPCGTVPGGEPGSQCATPLPTIAPSAAEKAAPLRVPSLTIAIDHAGAYAIDLGDAVLPNGILSETTATLADDRRSDVLIPQGIQLQVVGPDGKPLENAYDQGWRTGTERVHVRFVFTVESFDPGATLEITDVVVR